MFNFLSAFRAEPETKDIAYNLYIKATDLSRQPNLYSDYHIEDCLDNRFDLLTLHVSLLLDRLEQCADTSKASEVGQFLFDIMFQDMDQSMREKGVGDMGVPRRMKAMLEGFNGRHSRYRIIFSNLRKSGDDKTKPIEELERALYINIYNAPENGAHKDDTKHLRAYVERAIRSLSDLSDQQIYDAKGITI